MGNGNSPEIWEWAEYYCPWCYVAAVRLHKIMPEYQGRVKLRQRAFPLEIYGGGPPNRNEIELEIWLAALQEPEAVFKPFKEDWPSTTLPAFEAAWCAFQQGETIGHDFDLRIRKVFFTEGRNIGQREVMLELAHEAGLDLGQFTRLFNSGEAHTAVLEEDDWVRIFTKSVGHRLLCWLTQRSCVTQLPIQTSKMEKPCRLISCHVAARAVMQPPAPYSNRP